MEPELRIRDSYQWYEDVFTLPIDEASLCLFSHLGYVDSDAKTVLPPREARSFVYSLLAEDKLLNDLDRAFLSSVRLGTHLFTLSGDGFGRESEDIAFLAVEMRDVGWARSEEAYGIHYLLSKTRYRKSVALFRHAGSILLSFLCPREEGKLAIYLSDWMDVDSVDDGQMERYHVASTSLDSTDECFRCLAFEAMREYYKYPISTVAAWYCDVLGPFSKCAPFDGVFYSRSEMTEAVAVAMSRYVDEYGDDYVEDRVELNEGEDDFNLVDIEWELQNANRTDEDIDDEGEVNWSDEDNHLDSLPVDIESIPGDVLRDPVKLLNWINAQATTAIADPNSAAVPKQSTTPARD